jgi:hypothetical protein
VNPENEKIKTTPGATSEEGFFGAPEDLPLHDPPFNYA